MYIPPAFQEDRLEAQHALMRACPLGLLISGAGEELRASPLPFHLIAGDGTLGTLQAHLSRANTHWHDLDGQDVLIVFTGSDAYITPTWYAAKQEHGKVVPTWNYVMVQARGTIRVIEDPSWLRQQITALTQAHEASRAEPWQATDAPASYIDAQIKGIVGLEVVIRAIEGKWKVSQNRPEADREGVAKGLEAEGRHDMAGLVTRYGKRG
jgi:transcriptional regulator